MKFLHTYRRAAGIAATTLAVTAAGTPVASALPVHNQHSVNPSTSQGTPGLPPILSAQKSSQLGGPEFSDSPPSSAPYSSAELSAYGSAAQPAAGVTRPSGGFDWGDAAIGAAIGVALSGLAFGAVLLASRRRTRDPHRSTVMAG